MKKLKNKEKGKAIIPMKYFIKICAHLKKAKIYKSKRKETPHAIEKKLLFDIFQIILFSQEIIIVCICLLTCTYLSVPKVFFLVLVMKRYFAPA